MMRQSRLTAEINADALPAFPGVIEAFQEGIIPGAVERNREYAGEGGRPHYFSGPLTGAL